LEDGLAVRPDAGDSCGPAVQHAFADQYSRFAFDGCNRRVVLWSSMCAVRDRPWITIGAGARIGLVTGVLGGWMAAATTGFVLFAMRFWFHAGSFYDDLWQNLVNRQFKPSNGRAWAWMRRPLCR